MSYNLRDFSVNYSNTTNSGSSSCNSQDNVNMEKKAKEMIGKYQNMSNDELMSTLLNEVAKQKANGTFNREQLLQMLEAIKGMLPNPSQYEQLRQVIMKL